MERLTVQELAMFLGCDCEIKGEGATIKDKITGSTLNHPEWEVKPILRPLSDMTKEEFKILELEDYDYFLKNIELGREMLITPKMFQILLSKQFDVFGWIEKGLALPKQ